MSFARLEAFIFEKMAESKLPGVSAAIVEGGEVTWARGFGYRDLASGLPATPHTLYCIGSVTKSFTCLAILQLAEQGRLSVNDPVAQHLPAFALKPGGEAVRLWHLMTHTSGLPALAYAEGLIDAVTGARENWLPIASYADMLTFLQDAGDWALTRPGERWFYLNEGYVLLGAVVERCSGLPYEEYVRQRILEPLGMTRSFFHKADVEGDSDAATPYLITKDGERLPSVYAYGGLSSDGALISSVLDMARYIQMYLGDGARGETRLLRPESVAEMQTPRIAPPEEGSPFGEVGYAYGLRITSDFLGQRLVGHGGSVGTATAYMGFIPARQVGIMLLANGSGYAMSHLGMVGLATLLGADPEALPFVQRERRLAELEGTYETYKGTMTLHVRRAGDFLMLEERNRYMEDIVPLVPEKLDEHTRTFSTWRDGGYRLPVTFRVGDGQTDLIYERYFLRKK